jgi:hypothetical protein
VNRTFRWSHFAYAIPWRASSYLCASLISDRHTGQFDRGDFPKAEQRLQMNKSAFCALHSFAAARYEL